jgi:hypothetical protein
MEEKLKALLETAVTVNGIKTIPVLDEPARDLFACITFHFYNETGSVYGAGKATEETASAQVDFWYSTKTDVVKNAIKAVKTAITNEKYYSWPVKESLFDTTAKKYHTYFTFDLIKESEE